jgi:hypothetical protein
MEADDLIELRAGEVAIGPGPPDSREEVSLVPGLGDTRGHHLLGQYVEGSRRRRGAVKNAPPNAAEESRPFHQFI